MCEENEWEVKKKKENKIRLTSPQAMLCSERVIAYIHVCVEALSLCGERWQREAAGMCQKDHLLLL